MPRVRSAAAAAAAARQEHAPGFAPQMAAVEQQLGSLSVAESTSAVEAAVDSFADGRSYLAYGHDARVFDLTFHPSSSGLLISASDDCTAGVWRRQQGGTALGGRYMQVASFRGHGDSVMRAAWSPDGQMVATGSSDGVVCLWQPLEAALTARHNLGHTGTRQLGALEGHPEEVYACLFLQSSSSSGDGGGGGSGGEPSSSSSGGTAGSPGGQRLLTASGESLFLWDLPTQRLLHQAQGLPAGQAAADVPERWRPGYLFGVAAQPDGPLLGAACSDGRLRLWARGGGDSSLTPLCTLPWNQAMGSDCVFGPNGLFCAVSKDGSLIAMDVRQGGCLQHLRLDAPLLSCTLLGGDGRAGRSQCLVAAGADGAVHFADLATGEVGSLYPEAGPGRPLLCASLSSDGLSLAASGEAVVLSEEDLLGGPPPGAAATSTAGHQPRTKWSHIQIWQRAGRP